VFAINGVEVEGVGGAEECEEGLLVGVGGLEEGC